MSESHPQIAGPTIYLLAGEDEFEIAEFIAKIQSSLGDPGMVAMNLTRQDGRSASIDDLLAAAGAMPFLAKYRLVILENPTARINSPDGRQRLIAALEKIPSSTILVLVEYKTLTEKRNREKRLHWLEEWAFGAGERVHIKRFDLPGIYEMPRWIQGRAKVYGGVFTRDAANVLVEQVGNDVRMADQEIQKILTYLNYRRPVERDDVYLMTVNTREGDIFALVDALGNRNVHSAMEMLERLLEQQEALSIFAMIVRQFRLLIQGREITDAGGDRNEVAKRISLHPYVADKITNQAGRYSLPVLEMIYHRLLEVDEAIKTSQIPPDLALQTLVVGLGNVHPINADPEMVW
jgi:DNA polymerase-3 subunit delta